MLLPYLKIGRLEAGCDEAGRGCLAGPVYAAAVILPADLESHPDWMSKLGGLNDSKQLTEKQRYAIRPWVEELALSWAVGVVTAAEIDEINILNASLLAMHRAVAQLKVVPEHLLIDGNRYRSSAQLRSWLQSDYPDYVSPEATTIVKGDATYLSIAAASVLAKTYRDDYMNSLHERFPQYHWNENKGYPTLAHREAIEKTGVSPYHRLSYKLLADKRQLSLF